MLRSLVDVLIALIELVEAEGRALRRAAKRLGVTVGVIAVAAGVAMALLLGATGLLVAALFMWLLEWMHPALAAFACGAVIWLVVGVSAWILVRRVNA